MTHWVTMRGNFVVTTDDGGQVVHSLRFDAGTWLVNTLPHEAEEKAKDLFRAVAGQGAYETLAAGALPITGSCGTPYVLLPKENYCIERPAVQDQARS